MSFELIGNIWLISAAIVIILSFRATWRDWGYNIGITKEESWRNERTKPQSSSTQSEQSEGLRGRSTFPEEATWSLGGEVLARSLLIEKSNRIREPVAASGSNKG
tara:strand:+ start:295 stop:609 length:315 start_codon:yes stop_codon:yes gene_type:complete